MKNNKIVLIQNIINWTSVDESIIEWILLVVKLVPD